MAEKEKFFCRTCKGLRNHDTLHKVERRGSEDDGYFQWIEEYHIIECRGCDTISFLKVYGDSEMVHHNEDDQFEHFVNNSIYPEHLESGNELSNSYYLPRTIQDIYKETIAALKADSRILAAGGLRAIIEATCNHLKIKRGNLEQRIDLLHDEGHLSSGEAKRLHSIRFLGNDALHEIEKPKKEPLTLLLDIVNHLLANLFVNDKVIDGKVEKVVDTFPEFTRLLMSKIKKENIGKEQNIEDILGKSIRLIPKKDLDNFKTKLKTEVTNGKHDYISLPKGKKTSKYKIEKEPDFFFFI